MAEDVTLRFCDVILWFSAKTRFTLLVKNLNLHFDRKFIFWFQRKFWFYGIGDNMILRFWWKTWFYELAKFLIFLTKTWFCSFGRKHDFTVLEWTFEFWFLWKHLILRFWWKNSSLRFWQRSVNLWFWQKTSLHDFTKNMILQFWQKSSILRVW